MNKKIIIMVLIIIVIILCVYFIISKNKIVPLEEPVNQSEIEVSEEEKDMLSINAGELATERSKYTDANGDVAIIPKDFKVSSNKDEQIINNGLVIIGPDESEFVWIPTTKTEFKRNNFSTSFYTSVLSETKGNGYWDDVNSEEYKSMKQSVEKYGGFYMGRYEASKASSNIPAIKKVTKNDSNKIWNFISPQDITIVCKNMYINNNTVESFFPWGVNYDTTFQWLIDTGNKTQADIISDSTAWGNYTNSSFTGNITSGTTGMWDETKANNIYDLAGNYWEWTRERYGEDNYVMRSGGYNIMGGACNGDKYPASLRDPLPGNNHHPNVSFRVGLYIK